MDSGVIVKEFRNRFGAIIANGQGSMKGQIFRIAHLGYFDFADLFAMIAGLEIILQRQRPPGGTTAPASPPCRKFTQQAARRTRRPRQSMNILIAEPLAPAGIELFQVAARLERDRFQSQGIRAAPGRCRRAAGAQRRAGEPGGAGEGAQAARDRPRRRRRGQRRSRRRHRGRRAGDEHARRQRHLRGRAHARADAGHGAPHSAGQRVHQAPASGKRRSSWATNCAARRSASSAWAASAAKW